MMSLYRQYCKVLLQVKPRTYRIIYLFMSETRKLPLWNARIIILSHRLTLLKTTDGIWAIVLYFNGTKSEFSIVLSVQPGLLISFGGPYCFLARDQFDPSPPSLSAVLPLTKTDTFGSVLNVRLTEVSALEDEVMWRPDISDYVSSLSVAREGYRPVEKKPFHVCRVV